MLRGINLGPRRRVGMADLRSLFTGAGYGDVATYLQSGNLVLSSRAQPAFLERESAELISERFGFDVPVVIRTQDQLARVLAHDPLGHLADDPKRYQVSFLSQEPDAATVTRLRELAAESEAIAIEGREIYAWHPDGVARSKLWNALAGQRLGVTATARNWTTVGALLAMASEG